ncbi:MAG: hypothetical protein M0D55_20635 [Elusimicrobiota bacterium]|nr:MAG: hypothetical protein M0D55_20635 [Elusimicrobiota bacterium]
MNKTILALLVLATPASAQVVTNLPGGRGSIYIGNPVNLPGPLSGGVISPRISLPAPLLTPTVAVTLAPALSASVAISPLPVSEAIVARPLALPNAYPAIPASLPSAIHPSALTLQLGAASKADSSAVKDPIVQRERADELFDGSRRSADRKEQEIARGPIRTGRHVSLPENDLEREIGAY